MACTKIQKLLYEYGYKYKRASESGNVMKCIARSAQRLDTLMGNPPFMGQVKPSPITLSEPSQPLSTSYLAKSSLNMTAISTLARVCPTQLLGPA
jgi:hypothetical protein